MSTKPDPTATTTAASTAINDSPNKKNSNLEEPSSPSSTAAAERAMSHTAAWKPALDRRQSWSEQEYRHDLHQRQYMSQEGTGEKGGRGGGGFTEV